MAIEIDILVEAERSEVDDFLRNLKMVETVTGLSEEQIDSMSVGEFNEMVLRINEEIKNKKD